YCLANASWNGVMAPGTHCDLFVVFAPALAGRATDTLTVIAAGGNYAFGLAGTGTAPVTAVSVSPTSLSFGSVTVGATSAAQTVQITISVTTGVLVGTVHAFPTRRSSDLYCLANASWNGVMAPGTHCDLFVVFAPALAGSATGTLSISAAGSVYPVSLAGTGAAAVDTTSPPVSIASPTTGDIVTGTLTVSATASDNVGVVGVQFKLDI